MHARVVPAICILLATATVTQSRRWFAEEVNCWITQEKEPATWEDAQRYCEIDGAILASPLNMQLYDYMQALINVHNHSIAYFIGTRAKSHDYGQKAQYLSLEGRRLDDMPKGVYNAIEQLNLSKGDCLCMDARGIRAVSCWDQLPYICYKKETTECGTAPATTSAPTTTTSAPLPSTTIPPGYTYKSITGSSYKFHHQHNVKWQSANAMCASEGAHLVVINDAEEENIIYDIVKDAVDGKCVWTGLRDNRPGGVMDWRTVHGVGVSKVFHTWGDGRPLNDAVGTCALYCAHSRRLFDYSCDYIAGDLYFVCEISH